MRTWLALVDRTAVLFLGVAAGAAIGFAFAGGRAPAPRAAPPAIAPPPPTGPTPVRDAGRPAAPGTPAAPEVAAALECAMPFQQQLLKTVTAGARVRIGVFGDSFGDGVWSGLARLLPAKGGYDVVKFSQQATGFTRYKSLNLEEHARAQLGDAPIDVAVVSFGANDTQGVIDRDGHYAALMSPGWQKEIGARVDAFVAVLRAHGAMVYWVGLPRMRKESFDADIANMNAFYIGRMRALGVPFIDTRPYASDAMGQYAAYLPDPVDGHETLMRAQDGIHMSMTGYVWITRALAGRIRAYVDAARTMAGVTPQPTALAALPPPAPVPPPRADTAAETNAGPGDAMPGHAAAPTTSKPHHAADPDDAAADPETPPPVKAPATRRKDAKAPPSAANPA